MENQDSSSASRIIIGTTCLRNFSVDNDSTLSKCELKITINEEDEFLRLWQKSIDEHCIVIDKTLRLIDTPPAPFTDVNETVLKRDWTFVHNFA